MNVKIYGTRFDRQAQLNRWLRRGTSGLVSGNSEAAQPVTFSTSTGGQLESAGPDGMPGVDRGCKMWTQMPGSPTFPFPHDDSFAIEWFGLTGPPPGTPWVDPPDQDAVIATSDLGNLPRLLDSVTGVNRQQCITTNMLFQQGHGNGRGGFRAVWRFGFQTLSSTRRWFVGLANPNPSSGTSTVAFDPSTGLTNLIGLNMIGIGQDAADTSPQFMHNDSSGNASKISTGMANIVVDRLYKFSLFADPFGSEFDMSFESFVGGVSTGSATHHAASNLPVGSQPAIVMVNAGPNGAATALALATFYAEIQPWGL